MNQEREIIILHISDLHRSPAGPTDVELWRSLDRDIKTGYPATNRYLQSGEPLMPNANEIDLVVVSGDLTDTADHGQFSQAQDLLGTIADEVLDGNRTRLIVAPGNHDIDWDLSRAAYHEVKSPTRDQIRQASYQDSTFRLADSEESLQRVLQERARGDLYAKRFDEFASFVDRFYNGKLTFPVQDRTRQYLIFDSFATELGVVVVAFNSCDSSDHLWHRGSIYREAILNAANDLDIRHGSTNGPLRIAVWHHNILGSPHQSDFLDPAVPLLLAECGFALGLHGHVHQGGRLDLLGSHARIPIIWAGSLAVGVLQRPPSIPLLYNVVGIGRRRRKGWVHVRHRKTEWEAWSAFHDWSSEHRSWYDFSLPAGGGNENVGRHVYPNIHDTRLAGEIQRRVLHAKEITVIALAGLIVQGSVRDTILRRTEEGDLKATLCYGNPFSPHVRARLTEEESAAVKPDIAIQGVIRRVTSIIEQTGHSDNLRIRFFNNYPTMCLVRLDDFYVYYPLGYRTLGTQCPAITEDATSTFGQFLQRMEKLYIDDSVNAAEVLRTRLYGHRDQDFLVPDDIREVAVCAFPDPSTAFYRRGAQLVGRDLFGTTEAEEVDADRAFLQRYAGAAKDDGFYIPVTGTMYLDERQISSLVYELRDIAGPIRAPHVKIDNISAGELWNNDITLNCSDPSGGLEKLHAEAIIRICPSVVGSDLTLDTQIRDRLPKLDDRDRLMLEAYQSPYVLSRFRPHFNLAVPENRLSSEDQARLNSIAHSHFRDYLGATVVIDRLYALQRRVGVQHWDPPEPGQRIYFGRRTIDF